MNLKIPKDVDMIINILYQKGYEAYVVGGCVRDSILRKTPNDWDICTSAKPNVIINIFKQIGVKTIPTGLKHGTVTLVINNNNYEVTTYRIEGEYEDCRRPKSVIFTDDILVDLSRRDFTINAMAYNHLKGLIDPFGGKKDIYNKVIKAVGNAEERFNEDALRILRGVRFATQLNFKIEIETIFGMKTNKKLFKNISKERIREELNKILLADNPSKGFYLIRDLCLLNDIIPEMRLCVNFKQRNPYHNSDVFNHTMSVLDKTKKDLIIRLSALLHDIGKPECFTLDEEGIGHFYNHNNVSADIAEEVLKRLKYDNKTIKSVKILVKEHMTKHNDLSDKGIKRLIKRVEEENLSRLFDLQRADVKGSKPPYDMSQIDYLTGRCNEILNEKQPLNVKDLGINGYDLMNMGIKPGKEIGEILEYLLDIVLENPKSNDKEKLINIVEKKFL